MIKDFFIFRKMNTKNGIIIFCQLIMQTDFFRQMLFCKIRLSTTCLTAFEIALFVEPGVQIVRRLQLFFFIFFTWIKDFRMFQYKSVPPIHSPVSANGNLTTTCQRIFLRTAYETRLPLIVPVRSFA